MSHALVALVVLLAGCTSEKLEPLYCEGGVAGGKSDGGECLAVFTEKLDDDPTTIGSALLVSSYQQRYSLRRAGANKYELYAAGALAGTIEKDGSRVKVTLVSSPKTISLRSDKLGFFR